jgi:hypothetical protein
LKRCLERDESPCLVDEIALGGKRHAHAVRSFSVRQIAEAHDPQGEPRPALVAQLMLLDEAGHRHIMELAGKHRRAHHFGAELGIGKAEREGERRAADRKSKWCGTERKAKPERSEDKCDGHTGLWLILEREIGDDAAGEQDGSQTNQRSASLSSARPAAARAMRTRLSRFRRDPRSSSPKSSSPRTDMAELKTRQTRSSRARPYPASKVMLHHARIHP